MVAQICPRRALFGDDSSMMVPLKSFGTSHEMASGSSTTHGWERPTRTVSVRPLSSAR